MTDGEQYRPDDLRELDEDELAEELRQLREYQLAVEVLAKTEGDEAAMLLANGWTRDRAINELLLSYAMVMERVPGVVTPDMIRQVANSLLVVVPVEDEEE